MTIDSKNDEKLPDRLAPAGAMQLPLADLAPDTAELASGPRIVFCGDIDMRIDGTGKWYFKGSTIDRPAMVKLFASVMRCDEKGEYWLITPVEMTRITVEDAPFMAVELMESHESEQIIRFRTNVDTIITLDEDHPLRVETDAQNKGTKPYITVRDRLEALLERSIFYQLMEIAEEMEINGKNVIGVWSSGIFFPLGNTE